MLVDVRGVRDGGRYTMDDPLFRLQILLDCIAWQQVPAGSLPDDDVLLARLLGLGQARWSRLRSEAMKAWKKHADGRLYSAALAETVNKTLAKSRKQSSNARKRRPQQATEDNGNARCHGTATVTGAGNPMPVPGRELEEEQEEEEEETPSERGSSPRSDALAREAPHAASEASSSSRVDLALRAMRPGGAPRAARATRLPPDWTPSEADAAYARERGVDPVVEAESFRDHFASKPGERGRSLNWSASWRTWVRKAVEFRAGRMGGARPAPAAPKRDVSWLYRPVRVAPGEGVEIIDGEAETCR